MSVAASTAASSFLSTPSARRATRFSLCFLISTSNFYPRPPRGGRRTSRTEHRQYKQFLSTPSARRATRCLLGATPRYAISIHALREEGDFDSIALAAYNEISIHALREEGDTRGGGRQRPFSYFYPRPPRGGRPVTVLDQHILSGISIHALREEGDCFLGCICP